MRFRFQPISSITRGPRDTSMELLRIIAMAMVLVVHADFVALGVPKPLFGNFGQGLDTLLRVVFEMSAIVCVNIFILISGWYTIKPTVRGFMNFIFQVLFFLLGTYLVMMLFGTPFSWSTLAACFCLAESQWFIKAYAALYIIAPMLNLFAERATQSQLRLTVILFYVYQTVWGFMAPNPSVASGYTVFSFIGLYLLARYMRLYYRGRRRQSWLALYGVMTLLCVVSFFTFPPSIAVTSYANPLIVIGSLSFMMYFTELKMKADRWINLIAASSFAAFLFHHSPAMMSRYTTMVRDAYNAAPGLFAVVSVALVIVLFFLSAIVIDQLRILLWNRFGARITGAVERVFARVTDPELLRDVDVAACRRPDFKNIRMRHINIPHVKAPQFKLPRINMPTKDAVRSAVSSWTDRLLRRLRKK